jgi:hypothetical protein
LPITLLSVRMIFLFAFFSVDLIFRR